MRLALASLDQWWELKDENFTRCAALARKAKALGCGLIVFPEMTLTGYSMRVRGIAEIKNASPTLRRFEALARETKIAIVFGACLQDRANEKPSNAFCFAAPGGKARALYEKIHLFRPSGEEKAMKPGRRLGRFRHDGFRFGAAICYDLRFPELYASMAGPCDAFVTIANWPARRVGHWRALLIARAIENQCFSFGVNRVGKDGNGLEYERSSMAVSPEGAVLKPAVSIVSGGRLDVYDVDLKDTAAYRASFPTVKDKRRALYRAL